MFQKQVDHKGLAQHKFIDPGNDRLQVGLAEGGVDGQGKHFLGGALG